MMKPQFLLSVAGLLMLCAPGCCVFEHVFGCDGHFSGAGSCGAEHHCEGDKASKKCAKKCRKCMKCLEEHGGGGHCGYGHGDLVMGDGFIGGGDCGCGGGMGLDLGGGCGMPGGCGNPGGCASCGQGAPSPFPGAYPSPIPMMPNQGMPPGGMSPSSESAPAPASGINLSFPQVIPAIPPSETSSTQQIHQGTQQVSVEEFQRLPGVVISGPSPSNASTPQPAVASSVPASINVVPQAQPAQQASSTSFSPASARQIQQTGWAPVRK